ncbi:histidine utilization repressor [Pararhizobium antarcticum]|uniref:Histidine utilization repressor n=1 Tax=Pararhizobium antarcticum TaxID=1798805 RepID=A0A657LPQ0_9HYPH|nr:histidine utilization repressor [Pararhizobium antarcticum]OJF92579.1 histidine utilization repressor [Pararhizobium antarcticum]OJF95847.1 histidine utilization repressor [Rhizobium sp. 58]
MKPLTDSASPLYEKVKEYVLAHIGRGDWDRNRKLPSEHDLVASLGVSRMTVHRALRELTSEGYLLRIQGVGTFVAPPKPQSTLIEVANIATEIGERGGVHRAEVILLESIRPGIELLAAFGASRQIRVGHSIMVHFENGAPVQVEERFVNSELVPDYEKQDFTSMTTYDYLQRSTPMTEVEHVISAIGADSETARMLKLAEGYPCLLLRRRTWSGQKVATVNRLTYAGNRYSLGSRYTPSAMT